MQNNNPHKQSSPPSSQAINYEAELASKTQSLWADPCIRSYVHGRFLYAQSAFARCFVRAFAFVATGHTHTFAVDYDKIDVGIEELRQLLRQQISIPEDHLIHLFLQECFKFSQRQKQIHYAFNTSKWGVPIADLEDAVFTMRTLVLEFNATMVELYPDYSRVCHPFGYTSDEMKFSGEWGSTTD